jgi:hypothetical protein
MLFFLLHKIICIDTSSELIWTDPAAFVALLYSFKLCHYYTKNRQLILAELLHTAVSCTYIIWSCGLTCNLPFWVPKVDFNNYLVEYSWLTKLTHYVFCVHSAYVTFLYMYEYTYCSIFYNQPWKMFAHLFTGGYKITVQGVV